MKYIRKENTLYIRIGEAFVMERVFDSISKAKNYTHALEKKEPGSVRRYETLVEQYGRKEADSILYNLPVSNKTLDLGPRDETLGQEIIDATKTTNQV